jgi:hypothetical protein
LVKGRRMGVFSSIENTRALLRQHELTSIVDRSEARRALLARSTGSPPRRLSRPPHSGIISTEARQKLDVHGPDR